MQNTPLGGCSILVVEEHPFVAYCLQVLLEGAGAEVHSAARSSEALRLIERMPLSAAVLHDGKGAKGHRRIAQRLARQGLPCVVCQDLADDDEARRGVTVLFKPVLGVELVEAVRRLVHAEQSKPGAKARARRPLGVPGSMSANRLHFTETAT